MTLDSLEDRSLAAGEYVLGTLAAADVPAFEQALAQDAGLRADVAFWQDQLLSLSLQAPAVEPTATLWPGIQARVSATPAGSTFAGPAAAGAEGRSVVAPLPRVATWRRLGFWQGLSGLALAASVLLGSALLLRLQAPPPAERYVAVLQGPQGGGNAWVVEVRLDAAGQGRLRLVPVAPGAPVPAGRTLQFWTKAPGAPGPSSLGLVSAGVATELPLDQLQAQLAGLRPEQLFEITLEPEGGSRIGRPTGPVLYIGRAVRLDS